MIRGISTHALSPVQMLGRVRPDAGIGAVVLQASIALGTRSLHAAEARVALSSDTHPVADSDASFGFGSYPNSNADNLMSNTDWVR